MALILTPIIKSLFMKSLLTVLVAFSMTQNAIAQFGVGLKAGANITKVEGKSFKDEFRYGYHLGGFAEIGLGDRLSIQPEVLFNQFQTRVDSTFRSVYNVRFAENRDIKLNYLSIPILLNYKLSKSLSLQAGPQYAILMQKDKNLLQNGREAFNSGDFSVLGGAQIKISKLRLSGRYFVGLNNINDIDNQNKWKNQGFQLSAGFSL
jgi:hypothetical protein